MAAHYRVRRADSLNRRSGPNVNSLSSRLAVRVNGSEHIYLLLPQPAGKALYHEGRGSKHEGMRRAKSETPFFNKRSHGDTLKRRQTNNNNKRRTARLLPFPLAHSFSRE